MTNQAQPPFDAEEGHHDDEVSILALIRFLLQYRYLIIGSALVTSLVVAGSAMIGPRSYTVEASFMPQGGGGRSSGGTLGALAGQLGVTVPQGEPAQSPIFYADLLRSRELLGRLAEDSFAIAPAAGPDGAPGRRPLADLLGIDDEQGAVRRERVIRVLSQLVSASATPTGIVELEVTSGSPALSAAIAGRLIELVNDFNLETRQAAATAESRFVEDRMREAEASLLESERALRNFLEANRQFQGSPQLMFEYERLQRQVMHQQQVFTGLQQSLEGARFARVRDTPVITVVEDAERPVYPDSRRIPLRAGVGLVIGGILGILIAFVRNFASRGTGEDDPEYQKLREVWGDTLADLRIRRRRGPADDSVIRIPE